MIFRVRYEAEFSKQLKKLDNKEKIRIISAVDELADNPFVNKVLKGRMTGLRRLRVGDFRVVYSLVDDVVVVHDVGLRCRVYKKK
jgi:mRNA interferase RelE/StbE